MFETLYNIASKNQLDVVKSGYYFYYSIPKEKNEKVEIVSKSRAGVTFCPATDFKGSDGNGESSLIIKPTIWSDQLSERFIRNNDTRFNETPGASFQDASFNFKVMAQAKRFSLFRKHSYIQTR